MSIKQKLATIAAAFMRISNRWIQRVQGYWPTSDEIENNRVKSLANRLKAGSCKETLTNILEWQERNIVFWNERHPVPTVLFCAGLISILSFIFGLPIIIFLIIRNIQPLSLLSWFVVIWFVMLVSSIATTLTITIWIIHSNRKIPLKQGLKNVFVPSIPMNTLLENKLGVCRDYAKLTACLLSNICPNEEIYFAHAPGHIATGIKIENKLYMLDQRLPILTIDKWDNYRHLKKIERFARNSPKRVDTNSFLSTTKTTSLDTEKLAVTMTNLLKVKERTGDKAVSVLEIPWKKGAILYEDNEMVNYSLARLLKTKISSELIRIDQITRIEINRHKDDLMFLIHFS
jgi:predicted transglutaminase-like protease